MPNTDSLDRTLFISDNLPFLQSPDTESVDLVVIDPPFGKNQTFEGTLRPPLTDDTQVKVEQALGSMTEEMLTGTREFVGGESTGAGLIILMARHLGEHLGHVALTRQLWEQLEAVSD